MCLKGTARLLFLASLSSANCLRTFHIGFRAKSSCLRRKKVRKSTKKAVMALAQRYWPCRTGVSRAIRISVNTRPPMPTTEKRKNSSFVISMQKPFRFSVAVSYKNCFSSRSGHNWWIALWKPEKKGQKASLTGFGRKKGKAGVKCQGTQEKKIRIR